MKRVDANTDSTLSRLPIALSAKLPCLAYRVALLLAVGLSVLVAHVGVIVGASSDKQVVRSNAGAIVTLVQHKQIFGDVAEVHFPAQLVSKARSASENCDLSVAAAATSRPNPARAEFGTMGGDWTVPADFLPKPHRERPNRFAVVAAFMAAKSLSLQKGWLNVEGVLATVPLARSGDSCSLSHVFAPESIEVFHLNYSTGIPD